MKIGAPKEITKDESRVALTPQSAAILQKMGYECLIESGAGISSRFADIDYEKVGVKVVKTAAALWKQADILIKVRAPKPTEVKRFTGKQILISFIWPAQNSDLLKSLGEKGVSVIAMDMVPRISRAQKMDALSSSVVFRKGNEISNRFRPAH